MRNLAGLLPAAARRFGSDRALVTSSRTLSFSELDVLSDRFAGGLAARGLRAGDRVSLYSENRWEYVVAYHGALKCGLVVNPLNVMLTATEVAYIAGDAQIRAIIGSAERLASIRVGDQDDLFETRIAFGDTLAGCDSFDAMIAEGRAAPDPPEACGRELASIGYTSGTTGHPKGAMQPHEALVHNVVMTATMHGRREDDVMVTALPVAHVYGNVAVNATLMTGGTVVLHERFDPGAILASAEEHRATMIEGVPAMYAALLAHEDLPTRDLGAITRCTVGGQTIATDVLEAWVERTGAPLIELWGMTEIAGLGTTHALHAPCVYGSIGVSLPGVQVRVGALEAGSSDPAPGEPGELMIRGPIVMLGYWGHDEATAEVLDGDGWLRTGDVARIDETGHVFVVDRHKDMIITAGYNVYPAEIERVISAHEAVSIVAVGRQPDAAKGELARAYVVLKPNAALTEDELIAHCRNHLAAYKVPRSVRFVEALPQTSTGKIMRRRLAELDAAEVPA